MAFPTDRLPFKCEIGFLTTPGSGFYTDASYMDVTSYFLNQTVSINRGRANETEETQVMNINFELDNITGIFTPDNPESTLYPNVRRGIPMRYGVYGGESYHHISPLISATAVATTPDTASLDIVGDIDISFEIQPGPVVNAAVIAQKWITVGNQRSWIIGLEQSPNFPQLFRLAFYWSTDGTLANTRSIATDYVFSYQEKMVGRFTLDVDAGGGNRKGQFYLARKWGEDWYDFGSITTAGVTSIFSGSAPLSIGDNEGLSGSNVGNTYRLQVKNGIGGTLVANPDFTVQTPGATSFVDSTGKTWTIGAGSAIANLHYRFSGTIDSFEVTWPNGNTTGTVKPECRVAITASSIRRRLGQGAQPLRSSIYRAVGVNRPNTSFATLAYWPLEDEADSTSAASGLADRSPATVTGFTFGSNDSLPGSSPLPELASVASFTGVVPDYTPGTDPGWTTNFVTYIPTAPTIPQILLRVFNLGSAAQMVLAFESATQMRISAYDATGTLINTGVLNHLNAFVGTWGRWLFGAEPSGSDVTLAVVFYPGYSEVAAFSGQITLTGKTLGEVRTISSEFGSQLAGINIGHISLFDGYILAGITGDLMSGHMGELASVRFYRLCFEENILFDTGDVVVESGSTAMGPQLQNTFLDLLQECATASNAIFMDARHFNGMRLVKLYDQLNQSVGLALNAGAEDITNPLTPTLDDQGIRNQVESSRVNGSSYIAKDTASIAKENLYQTEVTVNLATDAQLPDDANWRLHLGVVEGMAYPPITIELAKAPGLIPFWLRDDLDVGDLITLINLPDQADSTIKRFILQGYTETLTPVRWTLVLNCTPYSPYEVTWFDNDYATLRLAATTSTLDAGINSTVGLLTVNLNGGDSWTTAPGDLPMLITLAGEQMNVTAVGAVVGGKQTFTVTRSVNGVVKSHIAGESVRLAYPVVLSLV